MKTVLVTVIVSLCALLAPSRLAQTVGQRATSADPLQSLAFLVGRWEGSSEGKPRSGEVTREYTRFFNEQFIRAQNHSVYPPQEKNPKGEAHEDLGVFSFDRSRRRAVFRQFHIEGFVNQYVADSESQPSRLVFTSEAIENIPDG